MSNVTIYQVCGEDEHEVDTYQNTSMEEALVKHLGEDLDISTFEELKQEFTFTTNSNGVICWQEDLDGYVDFFAVEED